VFDNTFDKQRRASKPEQKLAAAAAKMPAPTGAKPQSLALKTNLILKKERIDDKPCLIKK